MLFTITEVTDTEVIFQSDEEEVRFSTNEVDMGYSIKPGFEIEMTGDMVPYDISQYRRDEIRAHHYEEAACGNI